MFKNKLEIKEILAMEISDEDKMDLIAELKTTKTDVARHILVSEEEAEELLALEEGAILENIGRHFADRNDKNIGNIGYAPDRHLGTESIMIFVNNVEGYKLQYLDFDLLEEEYLETMTEEEMEDKGIYKLIEETTEDKVYLAVMDLFGAGADMKDECEIILNNNNKYKVVSICDERDEVGQITVELELI